MVIWSGWGILVVVFAALGMFVGLGLGSVLPADETLQQIIGWLLGGAAGGAATWFFARWRESKPGRVFIDEQSGQRFEVRPSAGSLFFIPTRYWAFILPGLGVVAALVNVVA